MITVLIVDDEFGIVDALRDLLEEEGYRVLSASNGREGLERIAEERPDLVLVDAMMPVMTGPEMIAAMRSDPARASIPVILTSAAPKPNHAAVEDVVFLKKPFSLDQLLGLLDEVLKGRSR